MKRSVKLTGLVIFLSLILAGVIAFAAGTDTATRPGTVVDKPQPGTTLQPQGKCCIAGEYKGHHKGIPSKTCPKPGEGDFIMVINQEKGCGDDIKGTVKDVKDGSTQNFTGKVLPREKCCYIQGVMKKPAAATGAPGEETKFWGTLCKKGAKWTGNGEYVDSKGCKGTWNMTQM
jgi:hypothetical protein